MSWPVDPLVVAGVLAAGNGLHLGRGARPPDAAGPRPAPSRRRWFLAGLAVIVIALDGPIDGAVTRSFSDHMLQHLLLTMVAAPLLLLGAPLTLALAVWPRARRRSFVRVLRSGPARRAREPARHVDVFFVVMWGAHVSSLYEDALRSTGFHALEHIAFIAAALVFWAPIVRADPAPGVVLSGEDPVSVRGDAGDGVPGPDARERRHVLYPTYATGRRARPARSPTSGRPGRSCGPGRWC